MISLRRKINMMLIELINDDGLHATGGIADDKWFHGHHDPNIGAVILPNHKTIEIERVKRPQHITHFFITHLESGWESESCPVTTAQYCQPEDSLEFLPEMLVLEIEDEVIAQCSPNDKLLQLINYALNRESSGGKSEKERPELP